MKKYSTLIVFLILLAIWSAFFSSIKFFLWWNLQDSFKPDLQTITWYLSLGGIFAYLIGGAFAVTFLKKYYLFIISLLSLIFVAFAYLIGLQNHIIFAWVIIFIGFLYGLWSVVKSVILAIEIKKTGISDTIINAIAGVVFVVSLIWGTLLGNILFEQLWTHGYLVIICMLIATAWISLYLNYDHQTFRSLMRLGWKKYYYDRTAKLSHALKLYIPDLWYICKNYTIVMVVSALLWSISTVVSQVSMEHSIKTFSISASTASLIFLYSALWAVVGNIISMNMWKRRWFFWIIFSLVFSFLIIIFPFVSVTFTYMSVLAFLLWVFFGISSNLVDAYFIKAIWDEDTKEYGSSAYGFILSIVLFFMMFLSNAIEWYFGYTFLMIILGICMWMASIILYVQKKV